MAILLPVFFEIISLLLKSGIFFVSDTISVFAHHQLVPTHDYAIIRHNDNQYWIGFVFFLVFVLYTSVKVIEEKKLFRVFSSVFSIQASKQLLREDYKLNKRIVILLSLGYILVIAYLLYTCNQYFNLILPEQGHFQQYSFFVILLILCYTIKFLAIKGICYVTLSGEMEREYVFNVLVFSHTVGIILFPVMLCLEFSGFKPAFFLYPGLIIYASFYLLRLFRSFVNLAFEQGIGIFYIFLYLCILEILPLLILIKFLLVNF